jgi:hypothetical protein
MIRKLINIICLVYKRKWRYFADTCYLKVERPSVKTVRVTINAQTCCAKKYWEKSKHEIVSRTPPFCVRNN